MNTDEIKQLKLGDYIKRSIAHHSDEYFMVTALGPVYNLRKVGSREIVKTENLDEFLIVDTTRSK